MPRGGRAPTSRDRRRTVRRSGEAKHVARRRSLIIVNRACRQGGRDLGEVLARLRSAGVEPELAYPESYEDSRRLLLTRAPDFDEVVLGGGDGTLSRALPDLLRCGRPLGILPLGTANDLARSIGIPAELGAAAELIAEGPVHRIDLGRVNGHYFLNAASIGVGVAVNRHLSPELKRRWRGLSYGRAMLEALREARPFTAEIDCDGQRQLAPSIQITVGNGRYYGGGMAVHADAAVDDGRLDVYSIRPQRAWRFWTLLPALRRGRQGRRADVDLCRGRRVVVRTSRPRMISADGELVSRTPALFEVVPAILPVRVPPGAEQGEGLRHAAQ